MRTIPDTLFKESWADLSDQERGTKWRRRKAVHALWSKKVAGEVDALLEAVVRGDAVTNPEHFRNLVEPVSVYWHD